MSVVANVAINVDSRDAVGKLRQVQSQSQATENAVGKLGAAVGKLAAAFGLIQAARFVFVKTAELESQTRSLQVLTGSAEKAGQIIKELQQLGAVTPFTSTELIESAKRLQAFGVETEKVVETTRRLADASGATGAELSGLVTAYGQVQAKGRLQGEELLQFQERGIALQEELRKMYGMTGEEFQKALSKGQVSAKAVEVALANLTSTGGKYANGAIAQSDTLNGRLSTLQDGVDALARRIGEVLTPALKAIFNQAIAVVDAINAALAAGRGGGFTRNVAGARQFLNIGATSQAVDNIAKGIDQVSSQKNKSGIQQNLQALQQYQRLLQSIGAGDPNAGRAVQLQGQILTKINQNLAAQKQLQSGAKQTDKLFTPPLLGAASGGGGGAGRAAGADKATNEANRAGEQAARIQAQVQGLQRQTELTKQLTFLQEQIANAEVVRDQQLVIRLQGEEKLLQLQYQLADALADAETTSQRKAAFADAEAKADQIRVGTAIELSKNEEERQKRFEELLTGLDMELLQLQANTDIKKQAIRFLEIENQLKAQGITLTNDDAEAIRRKIAEIQKLTKEQEAMNAKLQMEKDLFNDMANTVAGAFSSAFDAAVSGTENLGKALKDLGADLLATIGKMLIMYAIAQALGALGGKDGKGVFSFLAKAFGFKGAKDGAYWPGGFEAFADGGVVNRPTMGLIGEGGEPEYVIPASKMSGAMARYSAGARGNAVIPAEGGEGISSMSIGAPTGAIDVRYSVERINSVDYVTADQFQRGMAQAAQQGAKQGEQMTLRRLQQSRSTRGRLGLN